MDKKTCKVKQQGRKHIAGHSFPSSYVSDRTDGAMASASFCECNCQREALRWRWDSTHRENHRPHSHYLLSKRQQHPHTAVQEQGRPESRRGEHSRPCNVQITTHALTLTQIADAELVWSHCKQRMSFHQEPDLVLSGLGKGSKMFSGSMVLKLRSLWVLIWRLPKGFLLR